MTQIQLALSNDRTADELQRLLARSTDATVRKAESWPPCRDECCVLVVDSGTLGRLPQPLPHPERVVLIARDEPDLIKSAWDSGINSVVFDRDPLSTVVLAILSACLRLPRPQATRG